MASARSALVRKEQLLPLDLAALALATASLVILVAARTVALEPVEELWLTRIDYAAIVLFALLFVGKGVASSDPAAYARSHWFDVLGLLPLTQPLLGLDRWWPLVGVLIVLARASAALDRAFGERVLMRVFDRYRAALVEELTEPILVRIVGITRSVVAEGRYMASVGASVEARRTDIHGIVRKAVDASPKMSFVRRLPGVERRLEEAVDEMVTSAVAALTSEEMNRLVAETIDRALVDLEREMHKPAWKGRGLSLGDITRGLVRRA